VWTLLVLLAAEFAGLVALVVLLLVELLVDTPTSVETALALLVGVALAAVALGAVIGGVWRGRAWVRPLAVVFQVLIAAIGVGALQGAFAQPGWGWPLILVGVVGFGLLVSKPVAAWLSGRDEAS
jgi:hypothetical protein